MSNTNAKKHAATGGGPPEKKRKLNSSDLILQTIASLNNPSLPIPSPPPITTIRKAVTKNPYLLPPDERSQLQISGSRDIFIIYYCILFNFYRKTNKKIKI